MTNKKVEIDDVEGVFFTDKDKYTDVDIKKLNIDDVKRKAKEHYKKTGEWLNHKELISTN